MMLLERDWAIEILDELATSATTGRGSIVFLSGEAGAGKTATVRAFLDRLGGNVMPLLGACDPIPIPGQLWALHDLAESASPALRDPIRAGANRETLFRAALTELSAQPEVTIMVIEDVHWADDATLDLLRFLGRRVESTRGLVIATYRDDDSARLQRLRLVLGDLATAPAVYRMSLPPLSRKAVAQLADGRAVDLDELYSRSGGNAFFVTEVLASNNPMPERIEDAVRARYAHLSEPAHRLIELAAVLGQSIPLSTFRACITENEPAFLEAVESGALRSDGQPCNFDINSSTMPSSRRSRLSSASSSSARFSIPSKRAVFPPIRQPWRIWRRNLAVPGGASLRKGSRRPGGSAPLLSGSSRPVPAQRSAILLVCRWSNAASCSAAWLR